MADKEWVQHPGTKAFLKKLKEDRQEIFEQWGGGSYTAESADATVQLNSKALGNVHAIEDMIEWIEEEEGEE